MRFDKMSMSRGRRERPIDDLHKIKRGLQLVLSRTHSEITTNPKMGSRPLFIE